MKGIQITIQLGPIIKINIATRSTEGPQIWSRVLVLASRICYCQTAVTVGNRSDMSTSTQLTDSFQTQDPSESILLRKEWRCAYAFYQALSMKVAPSQLQLLRQSWCVNACSLTARAGLENSRGSFSASVAVTPFLRSITETSQVRAIIAGSILNFYIVHHISAAPLHEDL